MVDLTSGEWLDANRAQWDERVPLHLASEFYNVDALRAGTLGLYPIEERELAELFPEGLEGKRVLHLQCHFGVDSLILAQRAADVVGLDFSKPAVAAARGLAAELGLGARFIHANVYDARHILPEPESFDVVYTTWGTIGWLPDVAEWARIIAWYLKPGGTLYFADSHPAGWVFDDDLVMTYPYNNDGAADVVESASTYGAAGETASTRTFEWMHPLSETLGALRGAGLTLDYFHEHYEVPYRMFTALEPTPDRMFAWPDKKWLPLSLSLAATR
ncbi:class I SAM-dependent methyltransferase [Glaciihabitans arcticus]|uniref:Class I SAM-dependent methyltransferase n=1 Tax=Glaciihabitans arcticus TaxID=2668039 RepID=A0A4V2JEY1_9MICO|nr:class I SAM-dependent methyltransferase [Glaciihabitans arcticus]TBN57309.1 class I SAM-dependent methyltransferase [Glaciihabitans arcticus]